VLLPVVCKQCGLVTVHSRLDHAAKCEEAGSMRNLHRASHCNEELHIAHDRMLPRAQRCMNLLKSHLAPEMDVLEVGCGDGALLASLRDFGVNANGLEPDPEGARFVRNQFDLPVLCSTLEQADFGGQQFDSVVAAHVLEHVDNPVEFLIAAHRLLRPEGIVFLEVPNILRPKVGPRRLFSLAHKYHFSPRSLCRTLHTAGFTPIALREFKHDSFQVVARLGAANEAPEGESWQRVVWAIRQHWILYHASLQFAWRKVPRLRERWLYQVRNERRGKAVARWLTGAA